MIIHLLILRVGEHNIKRVRERERMRKIREVERIEGLRGVKKAIMEIR